MSTLIDRAETLARRARTATFERALERDVTAFSALLSTVPDGGPETAAEADIDRLVEIANDVVASIESRLERQRDAQATQLRLAEAVYRIRAGLEALALWRRHFHV